jgi:hypothetical protein
LEHGHVVDTTAARTSEEERFVGAVMRQVPGLHDWYHVDGQGRPWVMLSLDFVTDGVVRATLRLDFDGARIQGGWSPACLNWDAEVRAVEAGIDLTPPVGIEKRSEDPTLLADRAVEWFRWHLTRS